MFWILQRISTKLQKFFGRRKVTLEAFLKLNKLIMMENITNNVAESEPEPQRVVAPGSHKIKFKQFSLLRVAEST
jgi:hypothetical protein